jgi:hypothetical protein
VVTGILFLVGCFFAWFTWTQIARTKVFHQPPFMPPLPWILFAIFAIAALIVVALRFPPKRPRGLTPPWPWLVGLLGAIWAILWFGLVVLAFGIAPQFPPMAAVGSSLAILVLLLMLVPRWAADTSWSRLHDHALVAGSLLGSMAVSFVGFIGGAPMDLWFKIIVDAAAVIGLIWLRNRVKYFETAAAAP